MLITFEGIDGSGKSTQATLLTQYLVSLYGREKVILTREPGGTALNDLLRDSIIKTHSLIDPLAEMLLFIAMRRDHFISLIKPSILKNKIVICDRFIDSTVAYQGYGYNLDINLVKYLNNTVVDIKPNITFIMDDDIQPCLNRAQKNKYEYMDLDFYKKVKRGFLEIAMEESERCHLIDNKNFKGYDRSNTIILIREKIIQTIKNNLKSLNSS